MFELGNKTKELIQEVDRYSAKNYNPLPIVISRAEGIWVWDVEGNKYLDCLSAYSAANQGHRHPRIIQALKDQADLLTLTSRAFHNDQMGSFLRKICEISESEMALPMNTGAEAVETAFKAARKWGYQKKGVPSDSAEIIVCKNNFHGRTITIVSCSSEEQYRDGFGPFTPGFKIIEYGSLQALESAITPKAVAFFVEPIQGEAGILIPEAGFLTAAKKLCRKNNVLFMLDEIQTGLGRTGKLFAYQHEEDAKPDLLTLGKAISGGAYPVSVVVGRRDVLEVFNPGDHGSTFGGNPLGSAIAKEALQVILDEKLAERSWELGAHLMNSLKEIKSSLVREVRGKGLFVGVELNTAARPYCEKLMKLGVLAKETHDSVIRLAPPLVISKEDLDWMISQVKKVLV